MKKMNKRQNKKWSQRINPNQVKSVSENGIENPIKFEEYIEAGKQNLSGQIMFLKKAMIPAGTTYEITKNNLTKDFLDRNLSNYNKGEWVVYVFRLVEKFDSVRQLEGFVANLHKEIGKQKSNGFHRMSKINKTNERRLKESKQLASIVLYVGSSQSDNIKKRIADHICFAENGSAGLGLSHWPLFKGKHRKKIALDIYNFGSEVKGESIKLIEYELSKKIRPLLGSNHKS
jgi:hypothetical protein